MTEQSVLAIVLPILSSTSVESGFDVEISSIDGARMARWRRKI
jgi:hypothetical protein